MYHSAPTLHKGYRRGVETPEKMRALTAALYASKQAKQISSFTKGANTGDGRPNARHFVDLSSAKSEDSLTTKHK